MCSSDLLRLDRWLAAAARSPNPRAGHHGARTQVCQAAIDRAAGNPGRPRDCDHSTVASSACFTGREQPPPSFVQDRRKRLKASLDGSDVNHPVRIDAPDAASRSMSDSFVAFLPTARFFSSDSVALAQALNQGQDSALDPQGGGSPAVRGHSQLANRGLAQVQHLGALSRTSFTRLP